MIDWSITKLKFTLGIGCICIIVLLTDLSKRAIPFWVAMVVALVPLMIMVCFRPDEFREKLVRGLQLFASVWYLSAGAVLAIWCFLQGEWNFGAPLFLGGLAIGCIPCAVVLGRSCRFLLAGTGRVPVADEFSRSRQKLTDPSQ